MRIDDASKKDFYSAECFRGNWSTRQLDRQIQSMLYERTAKKTIAEYALGGMNDRIFASKYRLRLPDPKLLKREIEHEKQRLLEMKT